MTLPSRPERTVALFLLPSAGFVVLLQFSVMFTVTVPELSYRLQVTPNHLPRCMRTPFVARLAAAPAQPPATELAGLFADDVGAQECNPWNEKN